MSVKTLNKFGYKSTTGKTVYIKRAPGIGFILNSEGAICHTT